MYGSKSGDVLSRITDKIYVSGFKPALKVDLLRQHNIELVINMCSQDIDFPSPKEIKNISFEIEDSLDEDISVYLQPIIDLINRTEGNVLVHCYAGISRSVTVVAAYLLQEGIPKFPQPTVDQVMSYIRFRRQIANPNPNFLRQLKEFASNRK